MSRSRQLRINYPGAIQHPAWGVPRVRIPSSTPGCKRTGSRAESKRKRIIRNIKPRKRTKLRLDPFHFQTNSIVNQAYQVPRPGSADRPAQSTGHGGEE